MLEILNANLGAGGANLNTIRKALKELQGLNISTVAGAAAGTKMNIAAMRAEDTIIFAAPTDTFTDDKANITIETTKAFGTIALSTVVADNSVVVNGVTYTFKAGAAATLQKPYTNVGLGTTDVTAAANLMAAINQVEGNRPNGKQVVATVNSSTVTVTAVAEGTAGNAITLTKTGAPITVSGAGTLTGGTATGGFKSTTNLATKTVLVVWFNKQ